MKSFGRKLLSQAFFPIRKPLEELLDIVVYAQSKEISRVHPNPLNRYGRKVFSQADEDGLTLEILKRIDVRNGVFAEFGVGDGTENNTLVLIAMGWKGFWVGGEPLAFHVPRGPDFCHLQRWITRDNVAELATEGLAEISETRIDVASLDLDGNDIFIVERLLKDHAPKLFIVEYNAKFPPPIRWHIEYDPNHQWSGDDYFGASLASYADLFLDHGYFLACCNSQTGANAFFVSNEYRAKFSDVPTDLADLYCDPRYHLYATYGHPRSLKTIEAIFRAPRAALIKKSR